MKNTLMNTINKLSRELFGDDFNNLNESKQEVVMTEFIINYNQTMRELEQYLTSNSITKINYIPYTNSIRQVKDNINVTNK